MCCVTDDSKEVKTENASCQTTNLETLQATASCCGTSEVAANLVGLSSKKQ
ncbi:MAG: hypothetical protein IPK14_21010 [Blastocatellia bacterium]|nr:hypothetical protein [Blastocatellia bacterium]